MKKWVFLMFLFFLLVGFMGIKQISGVNKQVTNEKVNITKSQIYQGDLLLVNKTNPIHQEGKKSDIIDVSTHMDWGEGYSINDNSIQMSQSLLDTFSNMVIAAKEQGIHHFLINSSFRSLSEQKELYKTKGPNYALPAGYSEHNLGLAVDIGSTQTKMDQASEGKWLKVNAWKYGFILRYPLNKANITGIDYEPWHYRYVGLPHSKLMYEKELTLEEYIDFLKQKKSLTTTYMGTHFKISYYRIRTNITISIPSNHQYQLSGNNKDGVIVTEYFN